MPIDSDVLSKIQSTSEWTEMSKVEQVSLRMAAEGKGQMRGYEMTTTTEYKGGKYLPYRTTGQNVFIASAVAQGLDTNPTGLPAVVIGAGHERPFLGSQRDLLPISEVLAVYGMDVIVVDASTPHIDEQGLRDFARDQ